MSYLRCDPSLANLQSYETNLKLFARATCLVPRRFLRFSKRKASRPSHNPLRRDYRRKFQEAPGYGAGAPQCANLSTIRMTQ